MPKATFKRVAAMLLAMSIVMSMYTPMLAQNKEPVCGSFEHLHTEACFSGTSTEYVYACSADTEAFHLHDTNACYGNGESAITTCGYADFILHRHDSFCYNAVDEFMCELPEIYAHEHAADCYVETKVLVCEEPEVLGHTHTREECYEITTTNLCGLEEERGHQHDSDCLSSTLICSIDEAEPHSHDDSCYADVLTCEDTAEDHIHAPETCYTQALSCGLEETVGHRHEDACFTYEQTCSLDEKEGHVHEDACWSVEETFICELEESEPIHQHDTELCYTTELVAECGLDELLCHTHDPFCFDSFGVCICGYLTAMEHQHTDECIMAYQVEEGESTLVCTLTEHQHDDNCYPADETSQYPEALEDKIIFLTERIDALPTWDEIEVMDDSELEAAIVEAQTAYAYYEELSAEEQSKIQNAEKLLDLSWFWSAMPLAITDSETIYQINSYSQAKNTLVWGGTVKEKLGNGMSFMYWDAIIIDQKDSGRYYVTEIITTTTDKRGLSASTDGGFVVLLYGSTLNAAVGDEVTMTYNFTGQKTGAYKAAGYGQLNFGNEYELKPDQDNTNKLTPVETADTRDWIQVDLYNYGVGINDNWREDHNYPGFQQNHGVANVLNTGYCNFGDSIAVDYYDQANVTRAGGAINAIDSVGSINRPISGAMSEYLSEDGHPILATGTELVDYYTESGYVTKVNEQSINGLFLYDKDTGFYSFDSRRNSAQFDDSDDTFKVYEQLVTSNFTMYPFGNFLPFTDIIHDTTQVSEIDRTWFQEIAKSAQWKSANGYGGDKDEYQILSTALTKYISLMDAEYGEDWTGADAINEYFNRYVGNKDFDFNNETTHLSNLYNIDFDEPTDFFFSMTVEMNFIQPRDGLTGKMGTEPMVFHFTGDDDVWCYVDGKLFLDLSGIHRHVGGEIDFTKGEVRYYELTPVTGDTDPVPYKTVPFSELVDDQSLLNDAGTFKNYSTHKLKFFYTERGSGSGVYSVNFNFPLFRQNSISVTKAVSVDAEGEPIGDPEYLFQILKAVDGVKTNELFMTPGTPYNVYEGPNLVSSSTVEDNGIIRVKRGQTAVFPEVTENRGDYYCRELIPPELTAQYGEFIVDGTSTTVDYGILVGTTVFDGIESDIKDIGAGSTVFIYNNRAQGLKLGSLSVSKTVYSRDDADLTAPYNIEVTVDDIPLAKDTPYQVGETTRLAGDGGIITLYPGETAVIGGLLWDSVFTVKEQDASGIDAGFEVSYNGPDTLTNLQDGGVQGTITDETPVEISVVNQRDLVYRMPSTGGPGQHITVIAGGLMLLALAAWYSKKPKSNYSED